MNIIEIYCICTSETKARGLSNWTSRGLGFVHHVDGCGPRGNFGSKQRARHSIAQKTLGRCGKPELCSEPETSCLSTGWLVRIPIVGCYDPQVPPIYWVDLGSMTPHYSHRSTGVLNTAHLMCLSRLTNSSLPSCTSRADCQALAAFQGIEFASATYKDT